jgi:hypothetical protein
MLALVGEVLSLIPLVPNLIHWNQCTCFFVTTQLKTFWAPGWDFGSAGDTLGGLRTARSKSAALNCRSNWRLDHFSYMVVRK